jgi:hypothetical protein
MQNTAQLLSNQSNNITYATHVNNDVSKHLLFDWFGNNLAVFCIATYATHVHNDIYKAIQTLIMKSMLKI